MPNIRFDDFKDLANREGLSASERIDDPFDVRAGKGEDIFADIRRKLPHLNGKTVTVLDVGTGCGPIALLLIELCRQLHHRLWLIDSAEVLRHLPSRAEVTKVPGKFPEVFNDLAPIVGRTDVVLAYSVAHYVFEHDNIWAFLDRSLALLAPGGQLLLGDVPSWSKRKRMEGHPVPPIEVRDGESWPGGLTDAVIFGLMGRATEAGFDAYLVPQPPELPMANRRVDMLFSRPG
jgi:cyclopropane fatty-acyl-phospholipid synthase-like methyltransferase